MTQQPTPLSVIGIAVRAQYLANAAIRNSLTYQEKPIDPDLPIKLYVERKGLQWMYNNNPSNPLLVQLANYVLSLCGGFLEQIQLIISNLAKNPPVLTGPTNQSVNVGANATFSVSAVSVLPVFYQWYRNGVLIPGAITSAYTVSDAQLSDSGSTFSVKATNAAGSVTSNVVTLTVTASLIGYAYAGGTDYSVQLLNGTDNVPYLFTFPIVNGQALFVQFTGPVSGEFLVFKYPTSQGIMDKYSNPPVDTGLIPSLAFENVATIGSWNYVFSRTGNPFTLNSDNSITLSV